MSEIALRTPELLAEDRGAPLEAVHEAISNRQSDPPELRDDQRKNDLLAKAIGMKHPAIKQSGRPRHPPTEERVRLGL
jgi:hypothetical protein